jgi:hypothetical protein
MIGWRSRGGFAGAQEDPVCRGAVWVIGELGFVKNDVSGDVDASGG